MLPWQACQGARDASSVRSIPHLAQGLLAVPGPPPLACAVVLGCAQRRAPHQHVAFARLRNSRTLPGQFVLASGPPPAGVPWNTFADRSETRRIRAKMWNSRGTSLAFTQCGECRSAPQVQPVKQYPLRNKSPASLWRLEVGFGRRANNPHDGPQNLLNCCRSLFPPCALEHAQQFNAAAPRHTFHSVDKKKKKKQRALVGILELPMRRFSAPVNAQASWTEQLAFKSGLSGTAPAVE